MIADEHIFPDVHATIAWLLQLCFKGMFVHRKIAVTMLARPENRRPCRVSIIPQGQKSSKVQGQVSAKHGEPFQRRYHEEIHEYDATNEQERFLMDARTYSLSPSFFLKMLNGTWKNPPHPTKMVLRRSFFVGCSRYPITWRTISNLSLLHSRKSCYRTSWWDS